MMSSLGENATGVIGEGVAANYHPSLGWMGSLSTMNPTSGYWIIIDEADELCIEDGIPTDPAIEYTLHSGANLISFPLEGSAFIADALPDDMEALVTGIIGEGVAANYHPTLGWMGSLSAFSGGSGYWMLTSEAISFSYETDMLTRTKELPIVKAPIGYDYKQSTIQAFYFIESVESIEIGDWLLVYHGDNLIGARAWLGEYSDIPVMGDDGNSFTSGYIQAGDTPKFKLLTDDRFIALDGDIGPFTNNTLYHISNLRLLPEAFDLSPAYPNPFNPTTTLSFALPQEADVSIVIYDIQGRELTTLISGSMQSGYHSAIWNANRYSSGLYFVQMIAGEYMNTQKLMLVK